MQRWSVEVEFVTHTLSKKKHKFNKNTRLSRKKIEQISQKKFFINNNLLSLSPSKEYLQEEFFSSNIPLRNLNKRSHNLIGI